MNKVTLIFIALLFAAAFLIGSMWTKIKTLEGQKGSQSAGAIASPTPSVATATKVEVAISPNDPVKGNSSAKITIVEFADFQCPYCANVEPTLNKIFETYKDQIRLVYKNFPLPFHENAESSGLAALCAKEQGKFWEYHGLLFQNQNSLAAVDLKKYAANLGLKTQTFNSCLDSKKYQSQIEADITEAGKAGVKGTPAFFINGRFVSGAQPFENFKAVIDQELK